MKNNKIINSSRTKRQTNLENFVLIELVGKNGWQHYVYQTDECSLCGSQVANYDMFEQLGQLAIPK